MKCFAFAYVLVFICIKGNSQSQYQLAPPLLKYNSVFFKDSARLAMQFNQSSAAIHYTLNGSEPTENDATYEVPLTFRERIITIKAKTFGKNFLPSETAALTFIKTGLPFFVSNVTIPAEKYKSKGNLAFTDDLGGFPNAGNGNWVGFQNDTIEIIMETPKKNPVKEVLLHFLEDQGSWIFLPSGIDVYAETLPGKYELVSSDPVSMATQSTGARCVLQHLLVDHGLKTTKLKIRIYALKNIPDWHPGKGNHAWVFIDEIKVY